MRSVKSGGQITKVLKVFASQTQPLLDAAASNDPERIRQAQEAARPLFTAWVAYLKGWSQRVEKGEEQARTAKHVWDAIMLSAAAWEAVAGLATIAAKGPPGGPFPMAGGAAVMSVTARVELVEALRKLIAQGALDAAVVASLGKLASPPAAGAAVPLPDPSLPAIFQMGDRGRASPERPGGSTTVGPVQARTLQAGGNSITDATARGLNEANGLNFHPREWGRAAESLKKANNLPNDFHGKIMSTGDYLDRSGRSIDNILGYLP